MNRDKKMEEDPEYKKFALLMDKCLVSFDSITEWQDIIGFIARIDKLLGAFKKYPCIPRSLLLSKRLAQSLNAGLPTGGT